MMWGAHGHGLVVVFWWSSDSLRRWSSDTTTDNYTDGKPLPPPATKAAPCVPSLPRAAPGCVLGWARPGWAGVGRGRRWGVVVDSVRTVRRFVVVREGSETRRGQNWNAELLLNG